LRISTLCIKKFLSVSDCLVVSIPIVEIRIKLFNPSIDCLRSQRRSSVKLTSSRVLVFVQK